MKNLGILFFLLLISQPLGAACGDIIYVKADATGANDGSSWQDAFDDLEDALAATPICTTAQNIWVAKGTYKPSVLVFGTDPQYRTFLLINDVRIWGGFGGWETVLDERNHFLNPTILSADHAGDDVYEDNKANSNFPGSGFVDNSYHIMVIANRSASTRIDGFIFQGGNAVGTGTESCGGAIYNIGSISAGSSPLLFNCTFQHNNAAAEGGAIHSRGRSDMLLGTCRFRSNKSNTNGGAFYGHTISFSLDNTPTISNTIFWNNLASGDGGAIATGADAEHGFPNIINCTFNRNRADNQGGAIYYGAIGGSFGPNAFIENSIIYGNTGFPTISGFHTLIMNHSLLQGCVCNTSGNLNQDPQFIDQNAGNLRLKKTSPAIDAGFGLAAGLSDLDRNRRDIGAAVDMGAYEFLECPADGIIHVDSAQAFPADGSAWGQALSDFHMATEMACDCPETAIIKVAKGTYYPSRNFFGLIYQLDQAKFSIASSAKIYGGYDSSTGNQTSTSTFSGDLCRDDDYSTFPWGNLSDNAGPVCDVSGDTSVLDRITFTGGILGLEVDPASEYSKISKCTFIRNSATSVIAGVYINSAANARVEVLDCLFEENISFSNFASGGLYVSSGPGTKTLIDRCTFVKNEGYSSGGLELQSSSPGNSQVQIIRNCLFKANRANSGSHGIYISGFNNEIHAQVDNCTLIDGTGGQSAIIAIGNESQLQVHNSLLWNNLNSSSIARSFSPNIGATIDVNHCLIEETACPGGTGMSCGAGMIYATNPQIDTEGKPLVGSPAIDDGKNSYIGLTFFDLAGTTRIQNNTVDIGAFEYAAPCQSNLVLDLNQPPFNGVSSLAGAWSASQSITVKSGLKTPLSEYLILSAPNVIIEGSYERVGGNLLEIIQEGCQ